MTKTLLLLLAFISCSSFGRELAIDGKYSLSFYEAVSSIQFEHDGNCSITIDDNNGTSHSRSATFELEETSDGRLVHVKDGGLWIQFVMSENGTELCSFPRNASYDFCWKKSEE